MLCGGKRFGIVKQVRTQTPSCCASHVYGTSINTCKDYTSKSQVFDMALFNSMLPYYICIVGVRLWGLFKVRVVVWFALYFHLLETDHHDELVSTCTYMVWCCSLLTYWANNILGCGGR